MKPAFSSWRQAVGFSLLLAFLLTLPLLMSKIGWSDRRDVYACEGWNAGPFPWIEHQIFEATNAVDMAFIGSSRIMTDINSFYVQEKLAAAYNRKAEVFSLSWNWSGYDAVYFIARDLLDHRRVRTLVIYDEDGFDAPHVESSCWFRWGENSPSIAGMPLRIQLSLYASAVLGIPRHLLSLTRSNRFESPATWISNAFLGPFYADDLMAEKGSVRSHLGYGHRLEFSPYSPPARPTSADVIVYGPETHAAFAFKEGPSYQTQFVQKLARLCKERNTQLVILHLPTIDELGQETIEVRELPGGLFDGPVKLVGISSAKLFAGLNSREAQKLFFDQWHMNANGQDFFTPLITPILLRLYGNSNKTF